jgi:hypothetical protein
MRYLILIEVARLDDEIGELKKQNSKIVVLAEKINNSSSYKYNYYYVMVMIDILIVILRR